MGLEKNDHTIDVEVNGGEKPAYTKDTNSSDYVGDEGAVAAETFVMGDSWVAKVHRLAGKLGVEQRGIERVPSDERENAHMSQIGTMVWFPVRYTARSL